MTQKYIISIFGYLLITAFLTIAALVLFFLIALGSELTMPIISRDRPSGNNLYEHSNQVGWKLKPNLELFLQNSQGDRVGQLPFLSTDKNGYRSTPPFQENRPIGIVLGDSFAQGFFLSNEESIPWKIAELTNSNVINTGVGGYSTDQELMTLEKLASTPMNWVVLLICANDLRANLENESWGLKKPRYKISGSSVDFTYIEPPNGMNGSKVTKESDLCCAPTATSIFEFTKQKWLSYLRLLLKPMQLVSQIRQDYQWAFPFDNQYQYILPLSFYREPKSLLREWDITFQIIKQIDTLVKKRGANFFVVYIPEIAQMENQDDIGDKNRPQQFFMSECRERGINCIDPTEVIKPLAKKAYIQDDGHLAPIGANIIATIVSQVILNRFESLPTTPSQLEMTGSQKKPQLGEVIEFSAQKSGVHYLNGIGNYSQEGWGWSFPESWGTWSEGQKAQIALPLPVNQAKQLTILARVFTSPAQQKQVIEIWLNGNYQKTISLSQAGDNPIVINLSVLKKNERFALIEFRVENQHKPSKMTNSTDTRELALGIVSARFE